jgi:hypothetical protein
MDEPALTDRFKRLQPRELALVLRDFLGAEANRVDGGVGDVHFSSNVSAPDGGVDGRTRMPSGARRLFLPGLKTWQIKSRHRWLSCLSAFIIHYGVPPGWTGAPRRLRFAA